MDQTLSLGSARRAFGNKLVPWFALILVILVGVSGLIFVSITRLISSSGWVEHSYQILDTLDLTEARFSDAEAAERGYVATCKQTMISPFRSDLPRIYAYLASLRALTADNPVQQAHVDRLHNTMSNELARMSMVMSTALGGKQSKAEEMLADPRDTNAVGEILATITNMESEERKLLDVRLKNLRFFAQMTLGACVLAVIVCGGILGFVFWLIRRETARREKSEASLSEANTKLGISLAELSHYSESARSVALLGELLQTCRNTREALAIAGKHLTHLLPDMSGTIGLFNEARDQIEICQTFGNGPFVETFAPDDCWSLRRGRRHVSSPGSTEPSCGHGDAAKTFLCLPMMAQGETLGVLSVGTARAGDFSLAEHRTMQTITEQLSLALANLRLQETLRNQSLRDALTGLFNRRYLDDALAREIGRARRNTIPLSVIMIDLDHFKRFNDTNGHEGGDALLAEFGQSLSRVVRGEDIACRYGGEEFAVILPGADLAAAIQRAEELRAAVTRMSVKLRGATLARVTASLGVAALHDHGKTGPDLLKAADEALYEAKKEGRNRVVTAQRFGDHATSSANVA